MLTRCARRIDRRAVDADFARGRLLEARDGAQCRGLAAAGGPEQRQLLAGQRLEAHAAHRRHVAVVDFEQVSTSMCGLRAIGDALHDAVADILTRRGARRRGA